VSAAAERRARIAILVGDLGPGGAERQAVLLAASLDRSRFEPALVVWRSRLFYRREVEESGIEVVRVAKGTRADLGFPFRLRRELVRRGFDVWHGWLEAGSLWARLLSRGRPRRRPVAIASFRCSDMARGYFAAERFLARFSDAIVANGEEVRSALACRSRVDPGRILVIENAVDTRRFFRERRPEPKERAAARRALGLGDVPPDVPLVALVGRLSPQKDPLALVRAAASSRRVPFAALFVGETSDADLRGRVERAAAESGLLSRVRFLAPVPEIERVYDAADAVALPSLYEGCPNVLVEAVAAGLPVAASSISENRSALASYPRARFHYPGDASGLAGAIAGALATEEAPAETRGKLLERFSPERLGREFGALYERLLVARSPVSAPSGTVRPSSQRKKDSRLRSAQSVRP